MKRIVLITLLAAAAAVPAADIDFQGMVRSYTGATFIEGEILNEQTVDFTLRGWGDMTQILVSPYAYIGVDREPEIGVREAFIDLYLNSPALDLRIGKQTVVWGQADGAFITDIVSPQDMRNFILADFKEIRKGVPAIRATYYPEHVTLDVVWTPVFVPNSRPGDDSIWGMGGGGNLPDGPEQKLKNSEIFGKISYFTPGWTAEIMGAYAWDRSPIMGSSPSYERYGVIGGSFSTTVSSVVLRSEAAAYINRTFNTMSDGSISGTSEHHQLHGLVGADWSVGGVKLSSQYILQYIHDFEDYVVSKELMGTPASEFTHTMTVRAADSFFSDRLGTDLFAYVGIYPDLNALIRPSVSWDVENGVILKAGAELFVGDTGTFGQFWDNSLAFVSLSWHF